jgi:lipoprotein-releasing system ATP-binding protein
LLAVTNLSKQYSTPRGILPILSDINFSLKRGDSASIVGPSGSGKSTLLYVLGALEPPTAGTITIDGDNPFELGERDIATFRNTRVGFVFQDHLLLPQCTVLENVLVPTLIGKKNTRLTDRAICLIEQVGLQDRLDHKPAELSGVERQRVALARALIRKPPLLLCDEPTGSLDGESARTVTSLLFDLHRKEQTVLIIVTHNVQLAGRCAIRYNLNNQRLERVFQSRNDKP